MPDEKQNQPNNPLHGIKLADIMEELVEHLSMIKRAISDAGATDIRIVEMGTGNKINRAIAWRFN